MWTTLVNVSPLDDLGTGLLKGEQKRGGELKGTNPCILGAAKNRGRSADLKKRDNPKICGASQFYLLFLPS